MTHEWEQVSGDMTASEYGATFAQLDTIGDTVYGVNVVEVINMVEACGRDWDVKRENGAYSVSESYVDVDGIEWHKAKAILDSIGLPDRYDGNAPEYPETVQERIEWIKTRVADYHKLQEWTHTALTPAQRKELETLGSEQHTYTRWYSIPRLQRAVEAARYGGYTNGQSMTFETLQEAMEYHSIPASALWKESEYTAIPDDCKPEQEDIRLYNVEGIARLSGNDKADGTGCTWLQQFWGEIVDSAVDTYYNGDDATEEAAVQGAWRECLEDCCVCHKPIDGDAWANLDMNGELAHDSHFTIVTRAD